MSSLSQRVGWLALPYTRLELPGWGRLLRALRVRGPGAESIWKDAEIRRLQGKWHGYTMILDLRNWSERITYFLGRYYDLPSQMVLRSLLRPGDRMLDVGANIGMISLLAAHLVGPDGAVDAFEPNPICCDRIREMLQANPIEWVRLHPFGLSDGAREAVLTVAGTTSGSGTLSAIPAEQRPERTHEHRVQVRKGDDVVGPDVARLVVVKIDVEGHEVSVLRGLAQTLARSRAAVLAETVEAHLLRAGSSLEALMRTLEGLGYAGYAPHTRRTPSGYRLALRPLEAGKPLAVSDTLWLHPQSEAFGRLAPQIAR